MHRLSALVLTSAIGGGIAASIPANTNERRTQNSNSNSSPKPIPRRRTFRRLSANQRTTPHRNRNRNRNRNLNRNVNRNVNRNRNLNRHHGRTNVLRNDPASTLNAAEAPATKSFEVCHLAAPSRSKAARPEVDLASTSDADADASANGNALKDLDMGILMARGGCSSEKDICILPNIIGFDVHSQFRDNSEGSYGEDSNSFYNDSSTYLYDDDDDFTTAMGICHPYASMHESYLRNHVATAIASASSNIAASVHDGEADVFDSDSESTERNANANANANDDVEKSNPNLRGLSVLADFMQSISTTETEAAATAYDSGIGSSHETHESDNTSMSTLDSTPEPDARQFIGVFSDTVTTVMPTTAAAIATIPPEYDCSSYCAAFERPSVAAWLASENSYDASANANANASANANANTDSDAEVVEFVDLIYKCRFSRYMIYDLNFFDYPSKCPFELSIPMNCWNTTGMETLEGAFSDTQDFNDPIGCWDTSSVTSMSELFFYASSFDRPIGKWDTSKVQDMSRMFYIAASFDQDIGDWNTSSVTDASSMFGAASTFNQNIESWDVGNVEDMSNMFFAAFAFDQPLEGWDTARVTSLYGAFILAMSFDQPLETWDTSRVENLDYTFRNALVFNQPLAAWNVEQVTSMNHAFDGAAVFDQPLDAKVVRTRSNGNGNGNGELRNVIATATSTTTNDYWNIKSVTSMTRMFASATSFNQCLGTTWAHTLGQNEDLMMNASTATATAIDNDNDSSSFSSSSAVSAMFWGTACPVHESVCGIQDDGTPAYFDSGPWCQDESNGCYAPTQDEDDNDNDNHHNSYSYYYSKHDKKQPKHDKDSKQGNKSDKKEKEAKCDKSSSSKHEKYRR